MADNVEITARGIRVAIDPTVGVLARIEVERDGRTVAPFHRAPWAADPLPIVGAEDAPHLARLAGDFFCAPFAAADVEPAPAHGWTANSPWDVITIEQFTGGVTANLVLRRPVMGARVVKRLTLRDDHPFIYQSHVFEGGSGDIPVANHAMVSLPRGGRLSVSPKRFAETPPRPLEASPERGRSILAYPSRTEALDAFPMADGSSADIGIFPIGEDHEDFVMLVEAEASKLGWSSVVRSGERDVALMLKDPAVLPMTMLWFSNGGRRYAPWNGRHRNVLGVEDACAWSVLGHRASIEPNPLNQTGIPTAIRLDPHGSVDIRHIIGAAPLPNDVDAVTAIRVEDQSLVLDTGDAHSLTLPFDPHFLAGPKHA